MDIFELNKRYGNEDEVISEAEVVEEKEVHNPVVIIDNKRENIKDELNDAIDEQIRIRKLELATWAESKGILKGVPTIEDLESVWLKLKAGKTLKKAIEKVCSYSTWCKWRKEYPEIAAMEEECRQARISRLEEEMMAIADQSDRTRMGEVSRDKLMIETRAREVERLDRLTENRISKVTPSMVPIQINVGYGKKE